MTSGRAAVRDIHCHIGAPLAAEELIALMDRGGVETACVFVTPFRWSVPDHAAYEDTNDFIADSVRRFPGRLIGFACVNPYISPGKELRRCILQLGLRGVKIHPENHCFAVDGLAGGEMMETLAALQQQTGRKIPVLSHGMTTIGAMPDQFGRLAGRYPQLNFVIAHAAGFQNLYFPSLQAVLEHDNLYVDTAMTTVDDLRLREVLKLLGPGKVLFGSDHFARGQENLYGNFTFVLERAIPDESQRRMVLGGNLAGILEL